MFLYYKSYYGLLLRKYKSWEILVLNVLVNSIGKFKEFEIGKWIVNNLKIV